MKKIKQIIWSASLVFLPAFAFAQVPTQLSDCSGIDGIAGIMCNLSRILSFIVPLLIGLGVVYFVWGVVQYVIGGDEEAKTKGRDRIVYGIIGLAVIISVWGLVKVVANTFIDSSSNRAPTSSEINNLLPEFPN